MVCKANGRRCEECKLEEGCPSSKKREKEEGEERKEGKEGDDKKVHEERVSKLRESFKEFEMSKLKTNTKT